MGALHFMMAMLHFGEGLISVFIPIYFWGLGYPLWQILLFYFFHSFYFVALVLFLLPLLRKLSDKMMIFMSMPFTAVYFLGLGVLPDFPWLFYALPLLHAFQLLLFNVGYHLDFSHALAGNHIGEEVGKRFMVVSLSQFPAPFIGGILIATIGFQHTFLVGVSILLFSVVPLFFFPHRNVSANLQIRPLFNFLKSQRLRPFNLSGFGYAAEVIVGRVVWPLFIFLSIGSIENFGGVITLGLLASMLVAYLTGFLADHGKRRRVLSWSAGIFSFVWALRPFMYNIPLVVGSHLAGNLSSASLIVAWSSQYYKLSKAISDSGLFILSRELLYNLTRVLFIPVLVVLAYFLSLEAFFMVSFLLAAFFTLFFFFANKIHTTDVF